MRFFRNLEIGPGFGAAGMQFGQRLFDEVQRGAGRVHLEVGARAVAFDGIAPLGNLPFEFDLGERRGLGQINFHAVCPWP